MATLFHICAISRPAPVWWFAVNAFLSKQHQVWGFVETPRFDQVMQDRNILQPAAVSLILVNTAVYWIHITSRLPEQFQLQLKSLFLICFVTYLISTVSSSLCSDHSVPHLHLKHTASLSEGLCFLLSFFRFFSSAGWMTQW